MILIMEKDVPEICVIRRSRYKKSMKRRYRLLS